jgi:2'-5' RNA ligase
MNKAQTAITLTLAISLFACQSAPSKAQAPSELTISKAAFSAENERFEKHPNYLSLTTPYEPVRKLHEELQSREGKQLVTRGEAHITVITPPEFNVLKTKLSITDLNAIAEEKNIQTSDIEPICVGKGSAPISGREENTYFIVVGSNRLREIRTQIAELYEKRGGSQTLFDPAKFFPHITVGFTKADLHEHQGVIKDRRACVYDLKVE